MAGQEKSTLIDLALIDLPKDARPHSPEDLSALTRDMKINGQLQEIIVASSTSSSTSPVRYLVVAGVGRTLAARALGWKQIRAFVKEGLSEFDRLHLTFSENEAREDVRPLYQAYLLKKMMETEDLTQEKLAVKIGISRGFVSQYLMISGLRQNVQEIATRVAKLTLAHFLQLCRLSDPKLQIEFIQSTQKNDWSASQLKKEIDKALGAKKKAISSPKSPGIFQMMDNYHARKAAEKVALEKEDPLAGYWGAMKADKKLKTLDWDVEYIDGKWFFRVDASNQKAEEAMARWFKEMGKYFEPLTREDKEFPAPVYTQKDLQNLMNAQRKALKQLRKPK